MVNQIKIYHTRVLDQGNPYMFSGIESLKLWETKEPGLEELETHYLKVLEASISLSYWRDSGVSTSHPTYEEFNHMICERIFHEMNAHIGLFKYQVPQRIIAENKSHTSTSIGDIIQVDDLFYYVDGVGFKKLSMKNSPDIKEDILVKDDGFMEISFLSNKARNWAYHNFHSNPTHIHLDELKGFITQWQTHNLTYMEF